MGGDSAGVGGLNLTVRRDEKVFVNGSTIVGFTTSFRMGSLLRYSFDPPEHPKGFDDVEYMNTVYVDAIRDCFKVGGFAEAKNGQESGGTFLVGYRGRLYEIDCDFQVGIPAANYAAVGCGAQLCLGSLYSTTGQPPRDRLRQALRAAEQFSAGVRGPFVLREL